MIVTAIEQQKHQKERYSVFIDGEFAFGLIMQDILYFKLKEGQEISETTYHFIMENLVYIKAQDTALHYISYKMRTEQEVRKKLLEKEYADEVIERVIEFLKKYNYVNDLNYAQSYVKQSARLKPKGKIALKMELRMRGIKDMIISEVLEEIQLNELDAAMQLIEKKGGTEALSDEKKKRKIVSFLQRRGYSYDIIKEAMNNMEQIE